MGPGARGDGTLDLGYSGKHAASSYDAFGDRFDNSSQHDFRYTYLDGDVGIFRNVSAQFLLTFLDGREGPPGNLERNVGLSDAWFGLKYQLRGGSLPMAIGASARTPLFYAAKVPTTATSTTPVVGSPACPTSGADC